MHQLARRASLFKLPALALTNVLVFASVTCLSPVMGSSSSHAAHSTKPAVPPTVVKSTEEWRKSLTPLEYSVTREKVRARDTCSPATDPRRPRVPPGATCTCLQQTTFVSFALVVSR